MSEDKLVRRYRDAHRRAYGSDGSTIKAIDGHTYVIGNKGRAITTDILMGEINQLEAVAREKRTAGK